jgi:TolB-like protein/Flp pilus assembly protein TadD
LESAERRLLRQGRLIVLTPKVFDLLLALVERSGHLVSKEELLRNVWPDSFVEEANLSVNISALRRAIGDGQEGNEKYIETIPRVGYRFTAPAREVAGATGEPVIHSIAVLPLSNLSGDPTQEYFADGMTEELITLFAKISTLRVISRTSAMHFKETRKTVPEIARELGVDAVVEGAVVRDGSRVRISAQLIDARTDLHLWAQSYEGDVGDVLRLQDRVALAITNEIKVKVTPQQYAHVANARSLSPEVHELYLRGRFHWSKRTGEGLKKSIDYFQQAIERDPTYSLAYSSMADSYNMLGLWSVLPQTEVVPKAKAASTRALEIDDQLAEAHASLGWSKFAFDWDWAGAEREFKRAIELNPSYESAHRWLCNCLQQQGRLDEASVEIKVAKDLDPLSLVNNTVFGQNLYFLHNYDEAIEQERKTLELDHFPYAHYVLGSAYEQKGILEQAIIEFQKATTLDGNPVYRAGLGHAFAVAGRRIEARRLLDELKKLSIERSVAWHEVAVIYVGLDEKDNALAALETAYKKHSSQLNWVKVDPRFYRLHNDSRFHDLLLRMNLQP